MRKIFYLLLTLFFIFLLFYFVDVKQAVSLIPGAKWHFILFSVILGIIGSLLIAFRLKILFSIVGEIPILYIWLLSYVGALASLILPFSVGGFAMAYFLSKKLKASYAKTLAILFVDFVLGVLLVFVLALFAVWHFSQKKLLTIKPGDLNGLFLPLLLAILFSFLILIFKSKLRLMENLLIRVKRGISLFSQSKIVLGKAVILTLILALLGLIQSYFFFMAFGIFPPVVDFLLASSLLGALNLIPGVPAKIGQFETLGVLTLPYLLNLDKNQVFAVLLTSHLISIILLLVLGGFSIYLLKLDINFIKNLRLKWQQK